MTTAIGIREMYRLARSSGVRAAWVCSLVANDRPARSTDHPDSRAAPEKRCATAKAMIVSRRRSDRLVAFSVPQRKSLRRRVSRAPEKRQAAAGMPERDRDKMDL